MFEQTTATSMALKHEAQILARVVAVFRKDEMMSESERLSGSGPVSAPEPSAQTIPQQKQKKGLLGERDCILIGKY